MSSVKTYLILARFHSPAGAWLLFWPCAWGVALAGSPLTDIGQYLYLLALFLAGAFVMRGAGCVWNDFLDRKVDARVARTAHRPLAAGAIRPASALVFMILLMLAGLVILLQFPTSTILAGLAVVPLIFLYPLMKRITFWPQIFLGMIFNWGVFLGWIAITAKLEMPVFWLWCAGIFWTLGYDTIYACQDRRDDPGAGVKSIAVRFKKQHLRLWLYGFYTSFVLFLMLAVSLAPAKPVLAAAFLPLLGMAVLLRLRRLDPDDVSECNLAFRENQWLGFAVFLIFLLPRF